ncbi:MAG: 2'-5' RNA ligase family protein, partial [Firmicutes bacterium]|nr:2'-5' RNA ligase family protein [Bacillota bacterium]
QEGATVFLTPVVTEQLLALQASLRLLLEAEAIELHEFYQSGNWQPHSALGIGMPRSLAAKALEFSLGLDLPIMGQVQSIGLIEMIRQGPYVISGCELARWALGSGEKLATPGCPYPQSCPFRSLVKH